jgi:hypothetical protein
MDSVRGWLPEWAHAPFDWVTSPGVLALLSTLSIVLLVASLIGIPWFVARLPADYFAERRDRPSLLSVPDPRMQLVLKVLKNALGVLLFLAGLAMLVLPGQGVITLLVAVVLLDIPGKRRVLARILRRPRLAQALNRIRERAGEPPLDFDPE